MYFSPLFFLFPNSPKIIWIVLNILLAQRSSYLTDHQNLLCTLKAHYFCRCINTHIQKELIPGLSEKLTPGVRLSNQCLPASQFAWDTAPALVSLLPLCSVAVHPPPWQQTSPWSLNLIILLFHPKILFCSVWNEFKTTWDGYLQSSMDLSWSRSSLVNYCNSNMWEEA